MKFKKPLAVLAASGAVILAAVMLATVAVAASAAEPATAYGGCVSKSTGYLRVLERNALKKSVNGKCRSTERKITWYSRTGAPKGPKGDTGPAGPAVKSWTWTADGVTYTCTDPDGDLAYTCTGAVPSWSPTPTATPSPSTT